MLELMRWILFLTFVLWMFPTWVVLKIKDRKIAGEADQVAEKSKQLGYWYWRSRSVFVVTQLLLAAEFVTLPFTLTLDLRLILATVFLMGWSWSDSRNFLYQWQKHVNTYGS